jgi:hypothetical protein
MGQLCSGIPAFRNAARWSGNRHGRWVWQLKLGIVKMGARVSLPEDEQGTPGKEFHAMGRHLLGISRKSSQTPHLIP